MEEKTKRQEEYAAKLRDPRWQRRRLEIMDRDEFCCQICEDDQSTLNVHHRFYLQGHEPWEYEDSELVTLCEKCHKEETKKGRESERELVRVLLRCGATAQDLATFATNLEYGKVLYGIDVFLSLVYYLLNNSEAQKNLLDRYLEDEKRRLNIADPVTTQQVKTRYSKD